MTRELGFSDRVFGLGAGVFFLSYVALQILGALLVERWSARRMISLTMIAWGSMTALTALVPYSFRTLYRAFLQRTRRCGRDTAAGCKTLSERFCAAWRNPRSGLGQ
jgi:MFS family permease